MTRVISDRYDKQTPSWSYLHFHCEIKFCKYFTTLYTFRLRSAQPFFLIYLTIMHLSRQWLWDGSVNSLKFYFSRSLGQEKYTFGSSGVVHILRDSKEGEGVISSLITTFQITHFLPKILKKGLLLLLQQVLYIYFMPYGARFLSIRQD